MTEPQAKVPNRNECLRLLAQLSVGRVIFTVKAMPAAQPVHYYLDGDEVIFRTDNASELAAAVRCSVVGFEADHIDATSYAGWSVLGVGRAYEVTDPQRLNELAGRQPARWAPSHDAHTFSIPLRHLTGRHFALDKGVS